MTRTRRPRREEIKALAGSGREILGVRGQAEEG